APASVKLRFRKARKLRPLHREIGSAAVHRNIEPVRRGLQRITKPPANGLRHADMGYEAGAKKALLAVDGPVDELIDDHEGAGRERLLERAAGADRNDLGHPGALHGIDIGAVVDLRRRQAMAAAVTGQKDHLDPVQAAEQQMVGRWPERALDRLPARIRQPVKLIDPAAANNTDNRLLT